jgi:hypothetical protein
MAGRNPRHYLKRKLKCVLSLLSLLSRLFFFFGPLPFLGRLLLSGWSLGTSLPSFGKRKAGITRFFLSFALDKQKLSCYNGIGAEKFGWMRQNYTTD